MDYACDALIHGQNTVRLCQSYRKCSYPFWMLKLRHDGTFLPTLLRYFFTRKRDQCGMLPMVVQPGDGC